MTFIFPSIVMADVRKSYLEMEIPVHFIDPDVTNGSCEWPFNGSMEEPSFTVCSTNDRLLIIF
jgi:hypothetical protein